LIVDRYGDTLVVQCLSAGVERWRETIVASLLKLTGAACIYERSDVDVRELEDLPLRTGVFVGDAPPGRLRILENGLSFWVDICKGHKTGFYLDQRLNRLRLGGWARDRDVLDCFCYTGGFTVYALAGGARSVTAVDSSGDALSLARENLILNRQDFDRVTWIQADVFHTLRTLRDSGRTFDLIILDPPKFAPTSSQVERASRAYKDINLLAFKLLRPGGVLGTFSCSGGVSGELFQKIVFGAALDAEVDALIVERLHQGLDHPIALTFPEGEYLKGLVVLKR
jgi:23S rRNA (cytosine1962-C5)-methyltransferase